MKFEEFLNEKRGEGGIEYENLVKSIFLAAARKIPHLELVAGGGGSAANVVDVYIKLNGKKWGIECKKQIKDRMGSLNFHYDPRTKLVKIAPKSEHGAKNWDPMILQIVLDTIKSFHNGYVDLINFVKSKPPVEPNASAVMIPFRVEREVWYEASNAGYLKPMNKKIRADVSLVHKHYAAKDCYYMQIGGSGLFYLLKNPLNLPIPQLKGDIDIELGCRAAGSEVVAKYGGIRVKSSELKATYRVKTKAKSPYSLDKIDDIIKLFG